MNLKRLLNLTTNQTYFLFGPRGTGKTTFLKENFPNHLHINLLETTYYYDLMKDPGRLQNIVGTKNKEVIIDEVQKIPKLLDIVHHLIEKDKVHFILSGSSARKLKKANSNLLAGRALNAHLFPLTIRELKDKFELEVALKKGFLPTLYDKTKNISPDEYLESYVDTYLREEIQSEGLTRNLSGFLKFLETASFSQGEVVNFSEIARESGNTRKVIQNYFEILEDLLIGFFLPVFTKKAKRKLISHEKFYFFDVGVFQQIRPKGFLDKTENIWGAAVETLVMQELRAYNHYYKLKYEIYYWRSVNGNEVDFVLYGQDRLIAIEAKATKTIDRKDFKGLHEFKKDYPSAELYYLYCGERTEEYGDITAVPITNFFQSSYLVTDKIDNLD
ncbi:MAG: hypothetical protein A2381_07890 [Bdellovibrionales bacterium RIFOXYB1_FULL_37_110]|nr:MAG: hypothetical protein A2181_04655 [Bdellovibrionales bacterium RIFOXYA1_FULL_38_20]OFZ52524.1 MAG: hypothetical protein A2417_00610 [Bdellovibrionales bacterium RIFOXYC1_FULL_37_79]OFZ59726.1 MAG: hypothetical protein A2381_07890 [Bdellovibrionales bacterium RIFOXYB1_FULL_37_110]OFZ62653.1 MAG: hypothetical protein A2577_12210 [Bdellovibrionales bacterium RIFOXYD1_FULL_36_51]